MTPRCPPSNRGEAVTSAPLASQSLDHNLVCGRCLGTKRIKYLDGSSEPCACTVHGAVVYLIDIRKIPT